MSDQKQMTREEATKAIDQIIRATEMMATYPQNADMYAEAVRDEKRALLSHFQPQGDGE